LTSSIPTDNLIKSSGIVRLWAGIDACDNVDGISHRELHDPKLTVSLNKCNESMTLLENSTDPVSKEIILPPPLDCDM